MLTNYGTKLRKFAKKKNTGLLNWVCYPYIVKLKGTKKGVLALSNKNKQKRRIERR